MKHCPPFRPSRPLAQAIPAFPAAQHLLSGQPWTHRQSRAIRARLFGQAMHGLVGQVDGQHDFIIEAHACGTCLF